MCATFGRLNMRQLPRSAHVYIWCSYVAAALVLLPQILAYKNIGLAALRDPHLLWWIGFFTILVFLGQRSVLVAAGSAYTGLVVNATHIAILLLFPPPIPLFITVVAVTLSEFRSRKDLYKRFLNISHEVLIVGPLSVLLSLVGAQQTMWSAGSPLLFPLVLFAIVGYYVLDAGPMTLYSSIVDRVSPWEAWRTTQRLTFMPEFAASTIGALVAVVWRDQPWLLPLFVVPVVALQSAYQAMAQARHRGEQLSTVLAAGQRMRLHYAESELLLPVAEAARDLAHASVVTAYFRDPENPLFLQRLVSVPADATIPGPPRLSIPPRGAGAWTGTADQKCTIHVPLEQEDAGVMGLLRIETVQGRTSANDYHILGVLATQAAMALQNAQMHERALAQASEDGLTGLMNHRVFQARLAEEVTRALRAESLLSIMMIDLDNFGATNNAHGHQVGDLTLTAIAGALREDVRSCDIIARYGGDEFAVILPEADTEETFRIAQRITHAVGALRIVEKIGTIRISASIGIASLPLHAATREDLIQASTQACYAAKQAGNGRVCRPEEVGFLLDHDPVILAARLEHANLATVEALAAAVDAKDRYTRGHSGRVSAYAVAIARELALSEGDVARIRLAGVLHDVGKIGVPDAILSKTGKLTDEEFDIIKQHPVTGEQMLCGVPFLHEILPAVRHHHERIDGRGYPDGLVGDQIHQDAAILAVADSFDAMTSTRPYRPALPADEARRRVQEGSGSQFDREIAAAFERAIIRGNLGLLSPDGSEPPSGDAVGPASVVH